MIGKQLGGKAHTIQYVQKSQVTKRNLKLSSVAFDFGFEAAEFVLHARMPHRQIFIKNLAAREIWF